MEAHICSWSRQHIKPESKQIKFINDIHQKLNRMLSCFQAMPFSSASLPPIYRNEMLFQLDREWEKGSRVNFLKFNTISPSRRSGRSRKGWSRKPDNFKLLNEIKLVLVINHYHSTEETCSTWERRILVSNKHCETGIEFKVSLPYEFRLLWKMKAENFSSTSFKSFVAHFSLIQIQIQIIWNFVAHFPAMGRKSKT